MPKYAPGTDAYDEGRERRFRREATRRQNISDLLIGGGQIMQALGAARRAREERAANDLYAQRIEQLMSGGASGPAPSSVKPPNAPWAGQSIGGGEDMVSIPQ
ncbi:MAG: hypothetical protein FJZ00_13015, partial [Candidatus Sericytochromatia bacterium]|nr:hypothetical protein [Candidatus Tanganyikabacteria bacterium]